MAVKQFISLENLTTYDSLIKQVISDGDAKAIKAAALNGKKLELYTVENPTAQDQPRFSITLPFTQQEIIGVNGKATMFNESDGGGSMFTHNDGSIAYVGTNDGGENGLTGQLYTIKKVDGKSVGTRLNMTLNGFYYTNGANSAAFTADDEIATKGDIAAISDADKTVYATEIAGGSQDNFAKKYSFYQGSQGTSQNPDPSEKVIDLFIPKDMVISEGTVVDITFSNGKLWDGQTDVTEIIKGSDTPSAADAGKYIRLTVANATNDKIYIKASDLVDVYTGGTTSEIVIAIDSNNEITGTLVSEGIAKGKLDSNVQDALDLGSSALQPEDIESVADEDIEALFD